MVHKKKQKNNKDSQEKAAHLKGYSILFDLEEINYDISTCYNVITQIVLLVIAN